MLSKSVAELDSSVADFVLVFYQLSMRHFSGSNGVIRWPNLTDRK